MGQAPLAPEEPWIFLTDTKHLTDMKHGMDDPEEHRFR